MLSIGRPTPLVPAVKLSNRLGLKPEIWLKREDLGLTGSYKYIPAMAGCYYAKSDGAERVITYSIAGNWALAIAYAARQSGLDSLIYVSAETLDFRSNLMGLCEILGAAIEVVPTPPGTDPVVPLLEAIESRPINRTSDRVVLGCNGMHPAIFSSLVGTELISQSVDLGLTFDGIITATACGAGALGLFTPFLSVPQSAAKLIVAESAEADRSDQSEPASSNFNGLNTKTKMPALHSCIDSGQILSLKMNGESATEARKTLFETEGIQCAEESGYALAAGLECARSGLFPRGLLICLTGGPPNRSISSILPAA